MQDVSQDNGTGVQELIRPYLNAWFWIVICALLGVTAAHFYLRYTTDLYQATGVILIKDTQAGGGMTELTALEGIGGLGNSFNSIDNEIAVLKSRRLITQVVKKLKLHTEYIREGNLKNSEVYRSSPILLNIVNDSLLHDLKGTFILRVTPVDSAKFNYTIGDSENAITSTYGIPIKAPNGLEFFVVPNPQFKFEQRKNTELFKSDDITVRLMPITQCVDMYHSRIEAVKSERSGSIVAISLISAVKEKAQDIIDELIAAYNKDAINDANLVAQNTARFIDDRLRDVKRDLDSVESGLQSFKSNRNITELMTESTIVLDKQTGLEAELVEIKTQKSIALALKRNVAASGTDFIPENIGIESSELSAQSTKYNKLLLAYRNQLKYATPENPTVINLKSELNAAKQGIENSLKNYEKQLDIKLSSLNNEFSKVGGKIATVPLSERLNRGIERNRSVIESIYLLLSERREATAISLAITAPKAKIVDSAYAPSSPVSPNHKSIYLMALAVGIFIPLGFIYLNGVLYNKIESRRDLERALPNLSILGEVPKIDKNETDQIVQNDRSILAESFRILRTNLQFKLSTIPVTERATRVLVTSTVKGEGKTFVSYNLAATLANSGKKVVLVGGDIRNPQIHRYLDARNKNISGVTEFLVGKVDDVKQLTAPIDTVPGLDVILSGAIPPNPAELWMQGRTAALFEQLDALYDIVLVDSSPTILVTDTLLIKDYADVTVYVTRANYTDKPLLQYIKELVDGNKLLNVGLVINDVKSMNLGYGNKYGYTYNADTKTRLERFKAIFSKK